MKWLDYVWERELKRFIIYYMYFIYGICKLKWNYVDWFLFENNSCMNRKI